MGCTFSGVWRARKDSGDAARLALPSVGLGPTRSSLRSGSNRIVGRRFEPFGGLETKKGTRMWVPSLWNMARPEGLLRRCASCPSGCRPGADTFLAALGIEPDCWTEVRILWGTGNEKRHPGVGASSLKYGAPGRIRTSDHLVRSQVLYPAELRAHRLKARIIAIGPEGCKPSRGILCVRLGLPGSPSRARSGDIAYFALRRVHECGRGRNPTCRRSPRRHGRRAVVPVWISRFERAPEKPRPRTRIRSCSQVRQCTKRHHRGTHSLRHSSG